MNVPARWASTVARTLPSTNRQSPTTRRDLHCIGARHDLVWPALPSSDIELPGFGGARLRREAPADREEQSALVSEREDPTELGQPPLGTPVVGRACEQLPRLLAEHRARVGAQI